MRVDEALRTRVTVHRFAPGAVPDAVLERALDAAQAAPNHHVTFPWRFYVVGAEAREKLASVQASLKASPVEETRKKFLTPGLLLVVTSAKDPDPIKAREDYAATSCAIENLMLSLWSDGIGTKWATGKLSRAKEAYSILSIDSAREEIAGIVWAGRPESIPQKPPRPALRDRVVHVA